ncbi:MAG: FxLYD domain-containing protein [Acidimicrobiales bacterium]
MSRRWSSLAATALTAAALFGCGTSKSTTDATVSACTADPGGGRPTAEGQVVNTSSKTSSFFLRIGFYDASGNKVTDGVDQVGSIDPGKGGPWHATGVQDAKGPLTCKVVTLRRTVAVGG